MYHFTEQVDLGKISSKLHNFSNAHNKDKLNIAAPSYIMHRPIVKLGK